MELRHICGATYAVFGKGAVLGLYRLNERDIVLMDTGVCRMDRDDLDALIAENGFSVKGIFCSHAHYDHCGSTAYLRAKWGAQTAAQVIEAGIIASPEAFHGNYPYATYRQCNEWFSEKCFPADVVIGIDDDLVSFCGADFGVLQLPGHSAGQIGIITPDHVAYLSDCLMGPDSLNAAKLPTTMCIEEDLKSKEKIRSLNCSAYILAHHDVIEGDIGPTVDENIAYYLRKAGEVLDCLEDGMTADQWRSAMAAAFEIRTHNPFKLSVICRDFNSYVTYLEDTGRVFFHWENCTKHYTHTAHVEK
ncbi:MAG: MBL fold metallo-hydrolase [Oscillospiraceae bacterium]|nr:MBL fold metallo-hydrolase [Oscillospiraceae bacterium]